MTLSLDRRCGRCGYKMKTLDGYPTRWRCDRCHLDWPLPEVVEPARPEPVAWMTEALEWKRQELQVFLQEHSLLGSADPFRLGTVPVALEEIELCLYLGGTADLGELLRLQVLADQAVTVAGERERLARSAEVWLYWAARAHPQVADDDETGYNDNTV